MTVVSAFSQENLFFGEWLTKGNLKLFGGLTSAEISHSYEPEIPEANPDRFMKPRTGFSLGLGYEIGSRFGLELDVLYIQKGVTFEGSVSQATAGFDINFKAKAKINELSVPLMVKFKLLPEPSPYLIGGVETAYIISSEADYEYNNITQGESQSGTEDYKNGVNRLDFSLVFGGGFELKAGPVYVYIEGRYFIGLSDIAGTDPVFPEVREEDWVKTNALAVFIGVKL